MKESVLVFGANGFLGSVITKRMFESGFQVFPIVRPGADKSRISNLENLNILEVETSNWPQLVHDLAPNTIICAQWNGVLKQERENPKLQRTNIEPIVKIAVAAKESGVRSFVCFGSQAEAAESTEIIKEEFYYTGKSAYGNIKAVRNQRI